MNVINAMLLMNLATRKENLTNKTSTNVLEGHKLVSLHVEYMNQVRR